MLSENEQSLVFNPNSFSIGWDAKSHLRLAFFKRKRFVKPIFNGGFKGYELVIFMQLIWITIISFGVIPASFSSPFATAWWWTVAWKRAQHFIIFCFKVYPILQLRKPKECWLQRHYCCAGLVLLRLKRTQVDRNTWTTQLSLKLTAIWQGGIRSNTELEAKNTCNTSWDGRRALLKLIQYDVVCHQWGILTTCDAPLLPVC